MRGSTRRSSILSYQVTLTSYVTMLVPSSSRVTKYSGEDKKRSAGGVQTCQPSTEPAVVMRVSVLTNTIKQAHINSEKNHWALEKGKLHVLLLWSSKQGVWCREIMSSPTLPPDERVCSPACKRSDILSLTSHQQL